MARVFISHSTKDDRFVAEVESFVAELLGCDVFNDVRSIRAGRKFWSKIEKGIEGCEVLVVVVSQASMQSVWVRKEIDLARKLKKTIIPLRIEDCAAPIFEGVKMIDFRRQFEDYSKPSSMDLTLGLKVISHLPALLLLGAAILQYSVGHIPNAILFAGAAVCSEILVLLIRFCRILWKDEFQNDAMKVLASWIRGGIDNFRPGLVRNYQKALRNRFGLFNNRGLGLINANRLKLDQVFVTLRMVSAQNIDQAENRLITRFGKHLSPGTHSAWDFLRNLKEDGVALAVIGAPGCGKTTLLQHMLLIMASNQQRRFRIRAQLPAMIFLRDIQHEICRIDGGEEPTLAEILHLDASKKMPKLRIPEGWFEKQLNRGRMLILLDGLDEVGSEARRRQISHWMDSQIREYPTSRFIVTARPLGYQTAPLDRANVLEVRHFSPKQVQEFVHNWYHANEVVSRGNLDNKEVRDKSREESNDLLERLRQVPALLDLTCNPLLLTMICMVHRYRGELPGGRVLLYEEICKVLLEKWRQGKQIIEELRGDQKLLALMPLAAEMMELGVREIQTEAAQKIINGPLTRVGLSEEQRLRFLQHLSEDSGLLLEKEQGVWAFAHLTFQEYLAARYWATNPAGAPTDDFTSRVVNSWWHETLRLYGSQADASAIVAACLWQGDPKALALAFTCLEEAREVSSEVRNRAISALEEGLDSNDSEKFKIAAEAWFEIRNSHDLIEVKEGVHLRRSPISKAEYQLFLRAGGRHPDHWVGNTFVPGTAKDAVQGVTRLDGHAYTQWLNEESNQRGYRILRETDLEGNEILKQHGFREKVIPPEQKVPNELFLQRLGIPFPSGLKLQNEFPSRLDKLPFAIQWSISFGSLARVTPLELSRARALFPVLAKARAQARSLPFDLDLTLALDPELDRARAIALARALDFDLAIELPPETKKLNSLKSTIQLFFKSAEKPALSSGTITNGQVDLGDELSQRLAQSFATFDRATSFRGTLLQWLKAAEDTQRTEVCLAIGLKCFERAVPAKTPADRFVNQWARFWLAMMRLAIANKSIESIWRAWMLAGAEIALLTQYSLEMELDQTSPKGLKKLFYSKQSREEELAIRQQITTMQQTSSYMLTALCRQMKIISEGPDLYLVRETAKTSL